MQIALGVVAAAVPVAALGWKRVAQPSAAPSSGTSHRARGDQAFAEGRYGDALIAYQHAREPWPHPVGAVMSASACACDFAAYSVLVMAVISADVS